MSSRQREDVGGVSKASDTTSQIQRDFWLRHMRTGFGIFLAENVFVMFYLAITPHGPHRAVLWIVAVLWLVGALTSLLLAPKLSSHSWRAEFSAAWTIVSAFGVAGIAILDGGIDSPLVFLFFLPLAFVALAYTPLVAGGCGLATLAATGGVVLANSDHQFSAGGGLVLFATLAGVSVLSVAASVNRARREGHERLLSDQVAELAATDGLTGCAVHRVFYERFDEEIARSMRHGNALSLMMIDVDSFKSVNDTYGHLVGDHVLAAIGAALRSSARRTDVVGRLGGDEFAVLLPGTEPAAAVTLAERILVDASGVSEVAVTLSIGVSGLDRSTPTTERMVDDADFALYEVKDSGRNAVAVRYPDATVSVDRIDVPRVSTQ